ncbi:MAG: DUF362 domain-containing protein [Desulfobacterales bacterium]|nr:MAG: DUF362 domain-containing protein [Desulfobacterales bacterium]
MQKSLVAIVRYEKPLESVRRVVELSHGLDHLPSKARVFIKPNIVFWTRAVPFPKWGVITTSRVVEDMVRLLKERGIEDITIGEGTVTMNPRDTKTPAHAFEALGYENLKKRFGVRYINIFERPFEKVDLGDGVKVRFNTDILNSDFVVDLPVMKSHNQTVVSLGIKNLKGVIDIPSRKKCHNMNPGKDLHFWVAKLADRMPPMLTLLDGIYTNERGPGFDGRMRRSNLLIASADVLSADMVGAKVLGHPPEKVPYLVHAAKNRERPVDLSDVEVIGVPVEDVVSFHEHDFQYSQTGEGEMPVPLAKQGIKGLFYRKYDLSMCTYCSGVNGYMLSAIRAAWKGDSFGDVEILTGKAMMPSPGMRKTIMLGKCIYQAHKDNPDIQEMIAVKGCPPKPEHMVKALHQAGIDVDPGFFENMDQMPAFFLNRYEGKSEFDESFYKIE